jgi:hypothetical protein
LFGPEIKAYANEVFEHGLKFSLSSELGKEGATREERLKAREDKRAELAWFFAQYQVLDTKFFKYLNLNN